MKNCFDNYFMRPIIGMLTKKGPALNITPPNPFSLHSFSRGNTVLRRTAGYYRPYRPVLRSRYMGGY